MRTFLEFLYWLMVACLYGISTIIILAGLACCIEKAVQDWNAPLPEHSGFSPDYEFFE